MHILALRNVSNPYQSPCRVVTIQTVLYLLLLRIDKNEDSAAVIIRRSSSIDSKASTASATEEETKTGTTSTATPTTTPTTSSTTARKLPYVEVYQGQKKAKNPYLCVACNKKFAKSSLNSHVKAKHRSKATKVQCSLCDQVFDKHTKAVDHVALEHQVQTSLCTIFTNLLTYYICTYQCLRRKQEIQSLSVHQGRPNHLLL